MNYFNIFVTLKASTKLEINGVQLVIEKDGTPVDDDDVLNVVKSEVMLLLGEGEIWLPSQTLFNSMLEDNNFAINDYEKEMDVTDLNEANTSTFQEKDTSLIGNGSINILSSVSTGKIILKKHNFNFNYISKVLMLLKTSHGI